MAELGDSTIRDARKTFFLVFGLTLLLKVWLAASFPMTGDEAYFVQWAKFPAWGYYDHPPMVGWMLTLLSGLSSHPLVLRLVSVLLWSLIALGLVDLLKRLQPGQDERAWLLGAAFLVLPFAWALNLVTNDTVLILFVFVSAYCYLRGSLDGGARWYVAAGVALGLGLLSKYFAGLLAIAYFVHFVVAERHWRGLRNLLIVALAALPFAAINVGYNATHCWNNVMFNLYNRNESASFSLRTVGLYLVMMVYLITPWVAWRLLRARPAGPREVVVALLFVVPLALFLLLSLKKTVGLHWVLGFLPFVFLYAGMKLDAASLRKYLKWGSWLAVPHLVVLAGLVLLPASVWLKSSQHEGVVFHKHTPEIVAALRKDLPAGAALMASSYTAASVLSFHAGEYLPLFGVGTHHARQDDTNTDFRRYDGRPVRLFDRAPIDPQRLAPYFASVSVASFEVAGATFWYADGVGFNYRRYREDILSVIAARYYRFPAFLPQCGCDFLEKYGFPAVLAKPAAARG